MTIHYHGTPITPMRALYELAGRSFCVSFAAPHDVARCHAIGESVMLDNGAFTSWTKGRPADWPGLYRWAEPWLDYATTWAVIPDVIDGSPEQQDALVAAWPFGHRGAPVWHMNEPVDRALRLADTWPRFCVGSTSEYAVVLSAAWERRADDLFNQLAQRHRFMPAVHMLRGMACSGRRWPFASVDSTDIARNHHLPHNSPRKMADRWDSAQCAPWKCRKSTQEEMRL